MEATVYGCNRSENVWRRVYGKSVVLHGGSQRGTTRWQRMTEWPHASAGRVAIRIGLYVLPTSQTRAPATKLLDCSSVGLGLFDPWRVNLLCVHRPISKCTLSASHLAFWSRQKPIMETSRRLIVIRCPFYSRSAARHSTVTLSRRR